MPLGLQPRMTSWRQHTTTSMAPIELQTGRASGTTFWQLACLQGFKWAGYDILNASWEPQANMPQVVLNEWEAIQKDAALSLTGG